jgi:glutamine---fructose-6-phosphate transaminase (isomerizing)
MLCSHCVLPDNYPSIDFDANGVCKFCRSYKKEACLGAEALEKELKSIPKGGSPGTCVVPVSGGKDSTYVLYYLTKVFGLKTIAVNYDNGFTHPQATENRQRITERLGVELVTIRGNQRKLMVGNLRSFLASPAPAMVPLICTGCRVGIVSSACKVARERNVSLFVIGWSRIEDTPFKPMFLARDGGSVAMGLVKNLARNPRYLLYGGAMTQVVDYFHNYSHIREWGSMLRFLHPGVHPISFFDYIEYNPEHIQREVIEKVGWSCPDSKNSWQFDCQIKLVQNYLYRTLCGFTAYTDYLSAQIREGYITREQALQSLEEQKEKASSELDHVRIMLLKNRAIDLVPYLDKFASRGV